MPRLVKRQRWDRVRPVWRMSIKQQLSLTAGGRHKASQQRISARAPVNQAAISPPSAITFIVKKFSFRHGYGRVDILAGESVGVADAPPRDSQRPATPVAQGFADFYNLHFRVATLFWNFGTG